MKKLSFSPLVRVCGIISLMVFSGCTKSREESGERTGAADDGEPVIKGRIGMTCMDLTNPFFKLIGNTPVFLLKLHHHILLLTRFFELCEVHTAE